MGLFQKAIETYDFWAPTLAGVYREEDREPLAPVGHMIAKANVEITIDDQGNFISASAVDKENERTIIPATEASAGRSGTKANQRPHPLCDKLSYLTAQENYYIPQLQAWAESPFAVPKVKTILAYVKKGSVRQDLSPLEPKDDSFVRWIIVGLGEKSGPCWTDQELFSSYIAYSEASQEEEPALCMITGKTLPPAHQHAKGIVALNGNAKLISSNDNSGFTYRGRFTDETQAASISVQASQKAHNALRWMIANQGSRGVFGGRTFLCWNPQGIRIGGSTSGFLSPDAAAQFKLSDYKAQLAATLTSRKAELRLQGNEVAVIAAFDAATTGRLSLTYYNEITISTFLDKLAAWDEHCCWYLGKAGIRAPSLLQLVNAAFGTQRSEKGAARMITDDRVLKQQIQLLLAARLGEGAFPAHIRQALVERAGTPQAYEPAVWRFLLFCACSAINLSIYQQRRDETMSWNLDKHDRSFQFGRLLAVMERAEEDYYYLTGEKDRQTNAMKLMSVFRQRPWTVYEQVNRQLTTAYLPRLKPWQRSRYQKLKGEIIAILSTFPEKDLTRPLSELYLMGYDLQHNAFFETKKTENEEEQEDE